MANTGNLRPFSGANDYRRQNGRRKGSKNLSTIVDELLVANIDLTGPINEGMKRYLQNSPTTYAKAIALAMIIKAINGDQGSNLGFRTRNSMDQRQRRRWFLLAPKNYISGCAKP